MGGGGEWPDRGPAGSSELSLRKANAADLDAIADIIQAGWPDDPSCDYRYPGRKKYPDEFWTWTRREYQSYLEAQDKYVVLVMTAPVIEAIESEEGGGRPVAVGVWDVCVQKDSPPVPGLDRRRDANLPHIQAYSAALIRCALAHFTKYGLQQLHLWELVTHLDFRRRGAGTQLCNWGRDEAQRRGPGWALTVVGSPMGRSLYEFLGYDLLGTEKVKVDGEAEGVTIYAMVNELSA